MLANRRFFLQSTATSAVSCITFHRLLAAEDRPASDAPYKRASTDWLAKCRFGIGVHWTAQTVPRHGPPATFQKAVDAYDPDGFIAAVEYAEADYVLNRGQMWILTFDDLVNSDTIPAPNLAACWRLMPGITRDLR